jgi:hypothetical protein
LIWGHQLSAWPGERQSWKLWATSSKMAAT